LEDESGQQALLKRGAGKAAFAALSGRFKEIERGLLCENQQT